MSKTGVLKQYEKTFRLSLSFDLENGNGKIEIGRGKTFKTQVQTANLGHPAFP
jgi:hypothetical protein